MIRVWPPGVMDYARTVAVYLITRNITRHKSDYVETGLVVCTPREYLAMRATRPKG